MLDVLTSLPVWLGVLVSILSTCTAGLAVYLIADRSISNEVSSLSVNGASSLFRVVGIILGLVLSLAFTRVLDDWAEIETAINAEAAAISDIMGALDFYDSAEARAARATALEYATAVVDDDWPALADDRLGEEADRSFRELVGMLLALEPENEVQQDLRARILDDVDAMSDARQDRLSGALAQPRAFFLLSFLAFLATMALFGVYQYQTTLAVLILIYAGFIGLMLYLVVAFSDPFQGALSVDPDQLTEIVQRHAADGPGG